MAIAAFGFGLYCVYDGAIAYPNQAERANKYLEFKEAAEFGGSGDWRAEWREYARAQGWPTGNPGEPKTPDDFKVQFAMAGLCAVVGLALLAKVLVSLGRWIESDGTAIKTSWGQTVPYDKVTAVNKKDWPKKGIARIRYQDNGRQRKFVLDNFKFVREQTDKIMRELEDHISHGIITGAPPEAAVAAAAAAGDESPAAAQQNVEDAASSQ